MTEVREPYGNDTHAAEQDEYVGEVGVFPIRRGSALGQAIRRPMMAMPPCECGRFEGHEDGCVYGERDRYKAKAELADWMRKENDRTSQDSWMPEYGTTWNARYDALEHLHGEEHKG